MYDIIVPAVLVLSIVVVIFKTGAIRYLLHYQGWVDVVVTVGLFVLFHRQGTATAIMIAIFGGFIFSLLMSFLYRVMPHKRLTRTADSHGNIRWEWLDVPPRSWR